MIKILKTSGAIVLAIALIFVLFNAPKLGAFRKIPAAFYAKEFCSCYFVTERGEKACDNYARTSISVSDVKIDEVKKTVSAKSLTHTAKAKFVSELEGCLLE